MTTTAPVLALRDAVVGYDGHAVLTGLTLEVAPGEVVGLLGPNGSGKSTLIRGVLRLAQLQGGTIELFGVSQPRFHEWGRIGYVPQRLFPAGGIPTTVREVVAAGRTTSMRPFLRDRAADRARIDDAIASVGLADRARTPIATLSGGQQRRALIARALASGPELLILDEPTAGVDAENQVALAEILGRLAAAGTTIVLITHELGPAAAIVERAVVLRDGRIVHDGPPTGAPSEHDDEWHHHHGDLPERARRLGLEGPA